MFKGKTFVRFLFAAVLGLSLAVLGQSSGDYEWEEEWDEESNDPHGHSSVMSEVRVPASIQNTTLNAMNAASRMIQKHLDKRAREEKREAAGEEAASEQSNEWSTWIAPHYSHSHRHGMDTPNSRSRNNGGGSGFGADFGFGDLIIGGSFDRSYSKSTYTNNGLTAKDESDSYGFAIYLDWADEKLRVYGGIGYAYDSHDIKVSNEATLVARANSYKGDTSTMSLSTSVTCEYKVYDKAVYVAPYAGIRHAFIDTDSYRLGNIKYDCDSLNIVRVPLGVKIGQEYDFSGFYIEPGFNFYVEPVVGDTKSKTTIHDRANGTRQTAKSRMADEFSWNASLGVTAGVYGISFTLAYDFRGSQHEKEHGLSLSYNWCF